MEHGKINNRYMEMCKEFPNEIVEEIWKNAHLQFHKEIFEGYLTLIDYTFSPDEGFKADDTEAAENWFGYDYELVKERMNSKFMDALNDEAAKYKKSI